MSRHVRDRRPGGPSVVVRSTDQEIRVVLARRLAEHPYLEGQQVRFEVVNGAVHLFGTVRTRLAKQAAWDVAWSVPAVSDVEIQIRLGSPTPPADPSVAAALRGEVASRARCGALGHQETTELGVLMSASHHQTDPSDEPRAWVIAPRGDVDVTTCDVLAARLDEVIATGGLIVVLDLREVNFLDSSGIRVILKAAREIDDQGGRLWIENASGAIQRIFEVAGILEHLRDGSSGPIGASLR